MDDKPINTDGFLIDIESIKILESVTGEEAQRIYLNIINNQQRFIQAYLESYLSENGVADDQIDIYFKDYYSFLENLLDDDPIESTFSDNLFANDPDFEKAYPQYSEIIKLIQKDEVKDMYTKIQEQDVENYINSIKDSLTQEQKDKYNEYVQKVNESNAQAKQELLKLRAEIASEGNQGGQEDNHGSGELPQESSSVESNNQIEAQENVREEVQVNSALDKSEPTEGQSRQVQSQQDSQLGISSDVQPDYKLEQGKNQDMVQNQPVMEAQSNQPAELEGIVSNTSKVDSFSTSQNESVEDIRIASASTSTQQSTPAQTPAPVQEVSGQGSEQPQVSAIQAQSQSIPVSEKEQQVSELGSHEAQAQVGHQSQRIDSKQGVVEEVKSGQVDVSERDQEATNNEPNNPNEPGSINQSQQNKWQNLGNPQVPVDQYPAA